MFAALVRLAQHHGSRFGRGLARTVDRERYMLMVAAGTALLAALTLTAGCGPAPEPRPQYPLVRNLLPARPTPTARRREHQHPRMAVLAETTGVRTTPARAPRAPHARPRH